MTDPSGTFEIPAPPITAACTCTYVFTRTCLVRREHVGVCPEHGAPQ